MIEKERLPRTDSTGHRNYWNARRTCTRQSRFETETRMASSGTEHILIITLIDLEKRHGFTEILREIFLLGGFDWRT